MKKKLLFLCTGNSCRSQIAEGFAKKYLNDLKIDSAGTKPESINPYAIETMKEIGIDISDQFSKKINNDELKNYNLIITLCGDAKDKCRILNTSNHIHWGIPDPAKVIADKKETLYEFSKVRDSILRNIKLLKEELKINMRK